MEFSIPQAPAVGLTTTEGEGYAKVLDTSSFDPIVFLDNYNKSREAKLKEDAKAAMERKAKWKAYNIPVPTDIFESNMEEINTAIEDWGGVMQDAMVSGVDPDSPEFYKEFAKYKAKVNQAAAEGKQLEATVKGYFDAVKNNPDKYDPEKFAAWVEGLKEQPNLKARQEYVATTNPLETEWDFEEILTEVLPPETVYESASGVTTTTTSKARTRENIENNIAKAKLDPKKNAGIQENYEQGVKAGLWKTPDEMIDWYTNDVWNKGAVNKTTRESGGGGLNISLGDGVTQYGDVVVTDIYETNRGDLKSYDTRLSQIDTEIKEKKAKFDGGDASVKGDLDKLYKEKGDIENKKANYLAEGLNGVAISKNGKDVPPVSVYSDSGELMAFVPIKFYKTDKEGWWRVEGKRGKSAATYKTYQEADEKAKSIGGVVNAKGEGEFEVIVMDTATVSVPLSETNKRILKGHLGGFDVTEHEKKKTKTTPSSSTGEVKKKKALPQ